MNDSNTSAAFAGSYKRMRKALSGFTQAARVGGSHEMEFISAQFRHAFRFIRALWWRSLSGARAVQAQHYLWLGLATPLIVGGVVIYAYSPEYLKLAREFLVTKMSGRGDEVYVTLFTAAGATVFMAAVLTFSLAQMAIQQVAQTLSPRILRGVRGPMMTWRFPVLAGFTISLFIFGVYPTAGLTLVLELVWLLVTLILSSWIILNFYGYVMRLIDPFQVLDETAKQALNRINRLDAAMSDWAVIVDRRRRRKEKEKKEQTDKGDMASRIQGQTKAWGYAKSPQHLDMVKRDLAQFFELLRVNAIVENRQIYERCVDHISALVIRYLQIRSNATLPIPKGVMMWGTDLDDFLHRDVLDELQEAHKRVASTRDQELSRKIIRATYHIGLAYEKLDVSMPSGQEGTNPGLFACKQLGEAALAWGMIESARDSIHYVASYAELLVGKGNYSNAWMAASWLYDLAHAGTVKKQSLVVHDAVDGLLRVLRKILLEGDWQLQHLLPKMILDQIEAIAKNLVMFMPSQTRMVTGIDDYSPLAPFLNVADGRSTTAAQIFMDLANAANRKEEEAERKKDFRKRTVAFLDDLWHTIRNLGEILAKTESQSLFLIGLNIHSIGEVVIQLLQRKDWEEEKGELENKFAWLLSFYWNTYRHHERITKQHHSLFKWQLTHIGVEAARNGNNEIARMCGNNIFSIAEYLLEKGDDSFYAPVDFAVDGLLLVLALRNVGERVLADEFIDSFMGLLDKAVMARVKQRQSKIDAMNELWHRVQDELEKWKKNVGGSSEFYARSLNDAEHILFPLIETKDVELLMSEIEKRFFPPPEATAV